MHIKKLLKTIAAHLPFALTKNERYDRVTEKIIKKVCGPSSVCIDIGANEGKILSMFTRHCPNAMHYAFEPIPGLYHHLKRRYSSAAHIYNLALSNYAGRSSFNHVITDPAYSGLVKRPYDKPERDETIQVIMGKLDDIIPRDVPITLMKLDIEGGELHALQGAQEILRNHHPYVLFEFGKGGAEAYDVTPALFFQFLASSRYYVQTLEGFLKNSLPLSFHQFEQHFQKQSDYFFIAVPI